MDELILELIQKNNTVIVPRLGAFMASGSGASRLILFNQHLKFNDGLVANAVSKAHNIENLQALAEVERWSAGVLELLNSGVAYPLGALGELTKTANGELKFRNGKPLSDAVNLNTGNFAGTADINLNVQEPVKSETKETVEISETIPVDVPIQPVEMESVPDQSLATSDDLSTLNVPEVIEKEEYEEAVKQDVFSAPQELPVTINSEPPMIPKEESDLDEPKGDIHRTLGQTDDLLNSHSIDSVVEIERTPNILPQEVVKTEEEAVSPTDPSEPFQPDKGSPVPGVPEVKMIPSDSKVIDPIAQKEQRVIYEALPKTVESVADTPGEIKSTKGENPTRHIVPAVDGVDNSPVIPSRVRKVKHLSVLFWVFMIVVFLVSAGATYFTLNYDQVMGWLGYNTQENTRAENKKAEVAEPSPELTAENVEVVEDTLQIAEDTVSEISEAEDIEVVEAPVETVVAEPPVENTTGAAATGTYYLIAGSFRSEPNADNFVQTLKGKGISSALKFGPVNGLFMVSCGEWSDSKSAAAAIPGMNEKSGMKVWVMKY
jgi:cell division septation protein DedD